MENRTLCLLLDKEARRLALGKKKRGFGKDLYNGFGGKIEEGETIEQAAIRELEEESSVEAGYENLEMVGKLYFTFPTKKEWDQLVYVFKVASWKGEPKESEEMTAEWFDFDQIPYDRMWPDDIYWLPKVLEGKKVVGNFTFDEDNKSLLEYDVKEVASF